MEKLPIKSEHEKKSASWYAALTSKKRDNEEDEEFSEASSEYHSKSKSLELIYMRIDNASTPKSTGSINCNAISVETRQIIEGSLNMRRSETRIYKFNTRLLESVPVGDTAYMSRMIAMGANPNATCQLVHVSACHVAAMYNNDALELLLTSGAESLRSDKLGRTPLHLAAWEGHVKHIALLLNFPEGLRKRMGSRMSSDFVEEVKGLSVKVHPLTNSPCELNVMSEIPDGWSDGVEHNCRNSKDALPIFQPGWTPLHAASSRAQHHCVQLLLAAGADAFAQDILCRTPLGVAGSEHYRGYKIEVSNLRETVRLLLKAGSKFQSRPGINSNTSLHTAVELENEELVEELLQGGASATVTDSQGLTPMHICVKKRSKELLQLLANYEYEDSDPHVATVDAKDKTGNTVLAAAIIEGWTQGVCIALGAGASITIKGPDGDSPLHLAARLGNIDILQEIITFAKYNSTIDFRNRKGETAPFKAISHNQLNVLKLLLEAGASMEKKGEHRMNVFHTAAKYGNKDILDNLLEYDSHVTARIINTVDEQGYTPLIHAVLNNHPVCVEQLITKGAIVNYDVTNNKYFANIDKRNDLWTTPLHIAAKFNYCEIARIIIKHDGSTVHALNSENKLPLHEACGLGNREMITLLLHKGADLSGFGCKDWKTVLAPIDLLMTNVLKPTEFMQKIFDSFISSTGNSVQESNCEVTVDYGILIPDQSDFKQMRVIEALVNTGNRFDQNRLLLHPLVQSFLHLKWKKLLPFFYGILVLHICFVLSLNVCIVSVFYYKDKQEVAPMALQHNIWKQIVNFTVCLITIQEVIFILIKNKRYLQCLETWMKIMAIALTVILHQVISYESEWARLVATVALLFSWFEIMFLLSRFPNWGFYVLMFRKVADKVLKILLSFGFLIFGFSMCFMIQFRAEFPFESPWAAFVKTVVMMTTEYDYQTIISKYATESTISILRVIFLIFLILVSIVLMNLLVGVAVNDVNNLEMLSNIKRLEKQIEFIILLEDIVCNKVIRKLCAKKLFKRWSVNYKWTKVIILRPCKATCSNYNRLPARIREAIFERAQLQKKQSDKELGSMMFKKKLNEIHDAIVTKNASKSSNGLDDWKEKIIEDISKMRNDIDYLKNCVVSNRHRTLCSNKSNFCSI